MKRLLIVLFWLPMFALAQDNPLIVEGTSPDLYLVHKIAPKENYYSIGRMYNISPKEYAPYNNLSMDKGLALGQTVKIPLTATNFSQNGAPAAGEVLIPVYHTVKDKEGLYHISAAYNKLPLATLKKWNNISGDAVNNGTNIIIGYLKVKKDLSPLATQAVAAPGLDENNTVGTTPVQEMPKPVVPVQAPPKKIINDETVVVSSETEKEPMQVKPAIKKEAPATEGIVTSGSKEFNGGVFANDYNLQTGGKEITKDNGPAAVFKSTSGWEDGKYYCLYNNATSGTIVKITNIATGKSVYAKVLDMIPDIKQNAGLLVRVSNAAAEQLGISDEAKFDCTVEYSK